MTDLEQISAAYRLFKYDIFLSHSATDAHAIDAMRALLIERGFTVYTDRHDDPDLDRSQVNVATARKLMGRMRESAVMLYLLSDHAGRSQWMPWELGFYSGARGDVFVYPLSAGARRTAGAMEFLQLFEPIETGSLLDGLTGGSIDRSGEVSEALAPGLKAFLDRIRHPKFFGPGYRAELVAHSLKASDISGEVSLRPVRMRHVGQIGRESGELGAETSGAVQAKTSESPPFKFRSPFDLWWSLWTS